MAWRQRSDKHSHSDTEPLTAKSLVVQLVRGQSGSGCRDQHQCNFTQSCVCVDTGYRDEGVKYVLSTMPQYSVTYAFLDSHITFAYPFWLTVA